MSASDKAKPLNSAGHKKVLNYRCEIAGNRLFFAFRPLNGKQNKKLSLRLCGEYIQMKGSP
jgi:hypothetical protein